jgi:alpha-galactosidase
LFEIGTKGGGAQKVRDLWRQKDIGSFPDHFSAMVASHGVVLVKVSPGG